MDEVRKALGRLAEPGYAAFQRKLLPGVEGILGVRMGKLRKLAQQIAREDWRGLLERLDLSCYEEGMLKGLTLAYADMELNERVHRLSAFARQMDNWAVCDSTAVTCKFVARDPGAVLPWLRALAAEAGEYAARFGLVLMLMHLLDDPGLALCCLKTARACPPGRYYTDMARAWLAAEACVRHPAAVKPLLAEPGWDAFTRHMTVRKICESLRADGSLRAWARRLEG